MPCCKCRAVSAAIVTFLCLIACQAPAVAAGFSVAPDGNDANTGLAGDPFATPGRAQLAVRDLVAKGLTERVTVTLHGGTYRLEEPLRFGVGDGGTAGHAVIWHRAAGEQVTFSGGRPITGWVAGHDGIWRAPVPEAKAGTWSFRELFVNGVRRPRARYPNDGFLRVKQAGPDRRTSLMADPNAFPPLTPGYDVELVFLHDWSVSRIPVAQGDYATGAITLAHRVGASAPQFAIGNFEAHPRFFLENDPVFLDAPGEWLLHAESGWLLYRPLPGETIESIEVVAPYANALVVVEGDEAGGAPVRNLHFAGIEFEHAAWPLPASGYAGIQAGFYEVRKEGQTAISDGPAPAAVSFALADGCSVTDAVVRHAGGSGIAFGPRTTNCVLARSVVSDVSVNGIILGEGASRTVGGLPWWEAVPDQVATGNLVEDCLIEHCGEQCYGGVGIWAGLTAGTTIRRNLVRNLPYTGISIGWRWNSAATPARQNRIEGNHIHDVMQLLSDGGGIYTLGAQPQTAIVGNVIHSIGAGAGRAESNGMFLDEGTTGFTIEGNTIYDTQQPPLRFHRAGVNLVRGNTLALPHGVPPVRYGATPESNVGFENNMLVPAAQFVPPEP